MTAAPSVPPPARGKKQRIPKEAYPLITASIGAFATIAAALIGFFAIRAPQAPTITPSQPVAQAATIPATTVTQPAPVTTLPATPLTQQVPTAGVIPTQSAKSCQPLRAELETIRDDILNIGWYIPYDQILRNLPVEKIREPKYEGKDQAYGLLDLPGLGKFSFVVDYDKETKLGWFLYVDANQNQDLTDDVSYPITNYDEVRYIGVVTLNPGQSSSYYVRFSYSIDPTATDQRIDMSHHVVSIKAGCLLLDGKKMTAGIRDTNMNGYFNDLNKDTMVIDVDENQKLGSDEVFTTLNSAKMINGKCYEIKSIEPKGNFVELEEVPFENIEGKITNALTNQPVSGATIKIDQYNLSVPSDFEGKYKIQTCPGSYDLISVNHPDYILEEINDMVISPDRLNQLDVKITAKPAIQQVAEMTIAEIQGFDFLRKDSIGNCDYGELCFLVEKKIPYFYTYFSTQRGIQDLGDLGDVDLSTVAVPESGYSQQPLTVTVGHTYVVLARKGEEGHYIVLTVLDVSDSGVKVRYLYR